MIDSFTCLRNLSGNQMNFFNGNSTVKINTQQNSYCHIHVRFLNSTKIIQNKKLSRKVFNQIVYKVIIHIKTMKTTKKSIVKVVRLHRGVQT